MLVINYPEGEFMDTREAIANRIRQLCKEHGITPNGLSNMSAVTIKKLCDGLEITLGDFFSTPEFDELEQEIK